MAERRFSNARRSSMTTELREKLSIGPDKAHHLDTLCIRFNADGRFLAEGCGDGSIKVLNSQFGYTSFRLHEEHAKASPITALRFRPDRGPEGEAILSGNANGDIDHWHQSTGKVMHELQDVSPVYALDYDRHGTRFVSAGKDTSVRIYDESTKQLVCEMKGNDSHLSLQSSHSSRIYAVKVNPTPGEEHTVLSGGWDNTVQIWDLRVRHAVRYIYGPHICGDALDVCGGVVLTGSWRQKDPLELWDWGSGKRIEAVPWPGDAVCCLYAAQFSKEGAGRYIAAGGSGTNEARILDRRNGYSILGGSEGVLGFDSAVVALDFCADVPNMLAVASKNSSIRIYEITGLTAAADANERALLRSRAGRNSSSPQSSHNESSESRPNTSGNLGRRAYKEEGAAVDFGFGGADEKDDGKDGEMLAATIEQTISTNTSGSISHDRDAK